ncbi:OLC1v1019483C1 [Oldenlandia corymbosa var. corymbosa]|uniref:OLC1v1019483C1 n=1 Tax=Oldenlandia corymbosa var. corymbosa TaxID=529605 RepID=A0AAV1EE68_OLDCO|nr:OLC1v1019483C1 [Oldenlandia corymbosa var. corymbosa]
MMKGLEAHPNLKELTVNGIPISKHPSWMKRENDHMPSILDNLVRLELSYLPNCESLPALGDLPRLEHLKILMLPRLKRITEEFYALSSRKNIISCDGKEIVSIFPVLKTLELGYMRYLQEWSIRIVAASISVQVRVCPCLETVKMTTMPGLDHFPNLIISSDEKQKHSSEVSALSSNIHHNQPLYFQSLQTLEMWECFMLTSWICKLIPSSAPLDNLKIAAEPEFWPKDLHHLINIKN